MKKSIALCLAASMVLAGCAGGGRAKDSTTESTTGTTADTTTTGTETGTEGVIEVTGNGYGGEIVLQVSLDGETIQDIEVVSSHETAPVFDRAFPILRDRIIEAQSPIVDSVSGATISSYAVKRAVADAFKENGKDFGEINMNTAPERGEKQQLEDVQTQIVVVGGGPAGLSSAIAAKESGVEEVILVEKLDILSGNGKFDMNFFDLYRSKAKELAGTNMTKEEFLASKESSTDSKERKQVWTDVAYDLDEWLRGMGIELDYTYSTNSHMAKEDEYAGDHIQQQLEKRAYELGVDIRTGTKGLDLIVENDQVVGVSVENRDGNYNIQADAVILATGGFSYNKDLLGKYTPEGANYTTSNQMGATGDFVPVFEELGYKLENMDVLSMFSNILDPRRDLTGGADLAFRVDEEGNVPEIAPEAAYYITDQAGYDSFYRIRKHVDAGYYKQAETLEELAEQLGVNYEGLKKTIDEYNKNVQDKAEGFENKREFGAEGPYYGAKVKAAVHMTKGGVAANEKAQVINNDDEVVEGLYAAGEVTATSGAYSASVVFGKVSGQEAAKYVLEQ